MIRCNQCGYRAAGFDDLEKHLESEHSGDDDE